MKLTYGEAMQKVAELTTENVFLRGEVAITNTMKQEEQPIFVRSNEPAHQQYRPRDYVLRSVRFPQQWR